MGMGAQECRRGTLAHIVSSDSGIIAVLNPLPAGRVDPETYGEIRRDARMRSSPETRGHGSGLCADRRARPLGPRRRTLRWTGAGTRFITAIALTGFP